MGLNVGSGEKSRPLLCADAGVKHLSGITCGHRLFGPQPPQRTHIGRKLPLHDPAAAAVFRHHHAECLIKPSVPEKFRGKLADIVGRGDGKDDSIVLLHERQQHAEKPLHHSGAFPPFPVCTAHGLLHLVDP